MKGNKIIIKKVNDLFWSEMRTNLRQEGRVVEIGAIGKGPGSLVCSAGS